MTTETSIESVVQHYLDGVATSMAGSPSQRRDTLIRDLHQHIRDSIDDRTSGRAATVQDAYAVLSELDSPATYSDTSSTEAVEPKPDKKLAALSVLCSAMQIVGLLTLIANIPVVPAIAGFAAITNFFVAWSRDRTIPRLPAFSAVSGLLLIAFELSRAMS